jgi:Protein of unknown function (DUF3187)
LRRARLALAAAAVLALGLALQGSPPRAASPDDPFPLRNQLPFNLLFLDQTPRGAALQPPGTMRVETHLAYENTLAATDDLVSLFRADDFATFDGRVTEPILQAVAAASPSGSAFFLDGETARLVVQGWFGLARRLEAGVEIPFLLQSGGLFDSVIDGYHDHLGLPDGGRPGFARDRFVAGYVDDGESVFIDGTPGGISPGDITLSLRAALLRGRRRLPDLTGAVSLKLPTGDPRRLAGSGSADYGASISVSRRLGRHTLHGGYARSVPGGWDLAPGVPLEDLRSEFGAYAFAATPRTTLIAQILRSSGAFPPRAGSDLGRVALEIALGARHGRRGGRTFQWAIVENLDRERNTPDIGLFLGADLWAGPGGRLRSSY